jgi:nitrogen regulatory protein PII
MAHLVVLVLDRPEQYPSVLEAWEEAGITGLTILESTGLGRVRGVMRDDMPLLPSLRDVLAAQELHHRTLFSVIEDDATVERVISATERIVGGFDRRHTGLLFVVPVSQVFGLEKRDSEEDEA